MISRKEFCKALAKQELSPVERAVALLWYYRQTQEYEERTPSELAGDLHDEGFPRSNITRLRRNLTRSRFTTKGRTKGSFQLDVRRLQELDDKFLSLLKLKKVAVTDSIVPFDWVRGKRGYLERMVTQINGCYDYGFFDACAVMCRRLMESLIIEVYISGGRRSEIESSNRFFNLDKLVSHISSDRQITLGRNSFKTMAELKLIGDTAAHDRTYTTQQQDISNLAARYRALISDLLSAARVTV